MSNHEQIKQDDAVFNAAMTVLGEWPATRECSMRARTKMAAEMTDRIMDTVNALLSGKKRSEAGSAAALRRWERQKAKKADAAEPQATAQAVEPPAEAPKKRGRPSKAAPVVPPPPTIQAALLPMPTIQAAPPPEPPSDVPPLPPMPSAAPPAAANPFG
jgi:hypothetical protein